MRFLVTALAVACFCGVSTAADLEGLWEGFVSLSPGRLKLIIARFEPADDSWQGTIDVPGALDVPVKQVVVDRDGVRVEVEIEGQPVVFDGTLGDGRFAGGMTFAGDEYPFELFRFPEPRNPANRIEAWNEDLDHVVNRFLRYDKSFSPDARKRFDREIEKLRKSLATKSDAEVIVALSRAVAGADNAHTRLYLMRNRTALRRLPIRAYWFSDGLFVVGATENERELVGCLVASIAGLSPAKLKRRVASLFAGNPSWVDYKSPFFMTSPEILAGLGVIREMDRIPVRFACAADGEQLRSLEPLPLERRDSPTEPWWDLAEALDGAPPYLAARNRYYLFDYLEPQQAVYFRYNRAKNMPDGESFDELAGRLLAFVRTHELQRFIVDLRFNTGGDMSIAADFFQQLAQLAKEGALGELYVLIGRATFSAGISHAAELKQHTNATFVGEPVGDVLDTWSEGGNIVLPNSELTVHFTNGFHSLSNVARPELERFYWTDLEIESLEPDVLVPLSSTEFFAGRDPVLDAALGHGFQGQADR